MATVVDHGADKAIERRAARGACSDARGARFLVLHLSGAPWGVGHVFSHRLRHAAVGGLAGTGVARQAALATPTDGLTGTESRRADHRIRPSALGDRDMAWWVEFAGRADRERAVQCVPGGHVENSR